MRKHIPVIALALPFSLPNSASAEYLDGVTRTADCNGWNEGLNCGDDENDTDTAGDTTAPETGKYGTMDNDKAAAVESMSLGSLKALFR